MLSTAAQLAPGVTFTVEQGGGWLQCCIRASGEHAGAVARARWTAGRVQLETAAGSSGGSSGEQLLARECAQRLCKQARQPVSCRVQLGARLENCPGLAEAAAAHTASTGRQLELDRLRARVNDPHGVHAQLIGPGAAELEARIRAHLRLPLPELEQSFLRTRTTRAEPALEVLLFAPLYLSNACLNDCSYCGFRHSRQVTRVKLDTQAALAEARCLAEHGHRTLDLVSGEIPTDPFIEYVSDVCSAILRESPIERVHLNLGALSESQYERLRASGATGYHLYQETYTPEVFFRVHGAGPKRDMANRLDGAWRALDAGFRSLGLGILLGLGPLERDLALLARHAQLLVEEFPDTRLGFSLPRIRAAGQQQGFEADSTIDDETFKKVFLFLALEFPTAQLTLTTREAADMRDALLPLGVTKLSAGVSTAPGGYQQGERKSAEQFAIHDQRSLREVARQVRAAGRSPVFR